jgi:hypothetical protein
MADAKPPLNWRVFSMPKAGHGLEEYEDAYGADPSAGRLAIADGASESSFAGAWAQLLVAGFIGQPGPWSGWLPAARQAWQEKFQGIAAPWYVEEKVRAGAYATFLGVTFDAPSATWQAVAVGDCCLFHVRAGRLLNAFPVKDADAFGNQPDLIGSQSTSVPIRRLRLEVEWQGSDVLLLMTDALAQSFLRKVANNDESWQGILSLKTQEAFEAWTTKTRQRQELRNDDVTLMVISEEDDLPILG